VCFDVTTDQIFYIRQITNYMELSTTREYNGTIHEPFVDFYKAYDSVRTDVLYSILIEYGAPMKLVRWSLKYSTFFFFLPCVSPDIISLQVCTPKVVGV
jgi:negative regulator of genetic competence, sporulation and motility